MNGCLAQLATRKSGILRGSEPGRGCVDLDESTFPIRAPKPQQTGKLEPRVSVALNDGKRHFHLGWVDP